MNPPPDAILAELTTLLRRICEDDRIELSADTRLEDVPGLDSLRRLQAVAHLEEHFGVEIDVVALDNLCCVQDILNAIAGARPAQYGAPEHVPGQ